MQTKYIYVSSNKLAYEKESINPKLLPYTYDVRQIRLQHRTY